MKWFKHYTDANKSNDLFEIIMDLGFEGYGRYFFLLEILAEKFDGKCTEFKIHPAIVRESLRIRSWNKLETFLERIGNVRGMDVEYSRNEIKFNAPILLELQDRDFKKARKDREESAPKNKIKNKIKNKKGIGETEVSSSASEKSELPRIAKIWNELSKPPLAKVKSMSKNSTRYKACLARWKEKPDQDYWAEILAMVLESEFCMGKNDRNWVATIDFLTRPGKHEEVYEGKYSGKGANVKTRGAQVDYAAIFDEVVGA